MSFIIWPWHVFLLALAGWVNRNQQYMIECLITENQVLKEKLGKKRILLNDDQRRRLAVKGKLMGRKLLSEIACHSPILKRYINVKGNSSILAFNSLYVAL